MARKRRTSSVLEVAQQRLAGLKSINPEPNLGDDMTVTAFGTKITGFGTNLNTYNTHVAALDDEQNGIDSEEDELREWSRRWLSAIEAKYGPDSSEYEAVGGKRISERKKPAKPAGGTPSNK
jgi:hypothetical protein